MMVAVYRGKKERSDDAVKVAVLPSTFNDTLPAIGIPSSSLTILNLSLVSEELFISLLNVAVAIGEVTLVAVRTSVVPLMGTVV